MSTKMKAKSGVIGFALGAALTVGAAAQATGIPVVDLAHTLQSTNGWIAGLAKQVEQYRQQVMQYQQQVQQYEAQIKQMRQMYVNGDTYDGNPGKKTEFQRRSREQGVVDACPEHEKAQVPNQRAVCQNIVRFENDTYNQLIDVLETADRRDEEFERIKHEREGIDPENSGELQSNNNQQLALQARAQIDMQTASTTLESYQSVVRALKQDQMRSSQMALEGREGSIFVKVTRGVVLGAALQGARSRER